MNRLYVILSALTFLQFSSLTEATTDKVVCYFGEWAVYRSGNGKFDVENIDPTLCTHIIYSFVGLYESDSTIKVLDDWNALKDNYGKDAFGRFLKLKQKNPSVKLMVAIGGWNEGSVKYSKMAASATSRTRFIQSAVNFLQKYSFDGLDIDWEYPANRGGEVQDKTNYHLLIQEARHAFDEHGYILTAAVGAGCDVVDSAYDVPAMSEYLDFINIMAYDLHGSWDQVTGHHAALGARVTDSVDNQKLNIEYLVNYWISKGAAPSKLVLGMGLYGRSFTLTDSSKTGLGAPRSGAGTAGPYTSEAGMLGYNEICEKIAAGGWTVVQDKELKAPFAYSGTQWVGYDDVESIKAKTRFAKKMGLGGGMVWSVETDDFKGLCHGKPFPLLRAINEIIKEDSQNSETTANNKGTTAAAAAQTTLKSDVTTTKSASATTAKSASTTTKSDGKSEACTVEGFIRSLTDCSKFFRCLKVGSALVRYSFSCPSGTLFDLKTWACQWQYMVKDC